MEKYEDLILFCSMLIVAITTLLLLAFRHLFDESLINIIIVLLPSSTFLIIYIIYRKYHLRHIYTDEELKKRK